MIYNSIHKTNPKIIHCPSETYKKWPKIARYLLKKKGCRNDNLRFDVITWNNSGKKQMFENSCDNFQIEYKVLGSKILNWKNIYKIKLTCDYLEKSSAEFVLGVDSFDCVVVDKIDSILEGLEYYKCSLLFNASLVNWPQEMKNVINNPKPYKYLNAGVWIGERNYTLNFFKKCMNVDNKFTKKYPKSEQVRVKSVYFEDAKKCGIDYECKYFQTLNNSFLYNHHIHFSKIL